MEKAKQEAENKSRHPSSSSSSFTSEISQEVFKECNDEETIANSKNVNNFTHEMTSSQTDDLLELGAEGKIGTFTKSFDNLLCYITIYAIYEMNIIRKYYAFL